jgi:hypothetical protein
MAKLRIALVVLTTAVLTTVLAGCGTSEPKKVEAPPEPVTGLHALYQMFNFSHQWAPDALVYEFSSIHLADVKAQPGKAGAWQATFVSPSLQQSQTYTYSVEEVSASLHQGINAGKAASWSAPNRATHPFSISAAKIDSDQAYKTALTKAAAFDAKHPGMTITFQLGQTGGYGNAAWRVMWGEDAATSQLSILVDATTGAYVETLH